MRDYVNEYIDDKVIRRSLFNVLRNYDYLDKFYDVLDKYDLCGDFYDYSYYYYTGVFTRWCKKNNI